MRLDGFDDDFRWSLNDDVANKENRKRYCIGVAINHAQILLEKEYGKSNNDIATLLGVTPKCIRENL